MWGGRGQRALNAVAIRTKPQGTSFCNGFLWATAQLLVTSVSPVSLVDEFIFLLMV